MLRIYEKLKELGVVENQIEFSRLCGKSATWFSCVKTRRMGLSSDATLVLAYKVRKIAEGTICEKQHTKLAEILAEIEEYTVENIGKRLDETV